MPSIVASLIIYKPQKIKKIAAIVFTQGCNFRCGYCHNPELLDLRSDKSTAVSLHDFWDFLNSRKGKIDGIVITGGEPCLQKDLPDFITEIKKSGFLVKLDTNGSFPDKLIKLLDMNLLDYIAMDIKAPVNRYHKITGCTVNEKAIRQSISAIMNRGVDYEFRTTVVSSLLDFDDFEQIGQLLNGAKRYYLQKFVASNIYDESLQSVQTYTDSEFESICCKLKKYISVVEYR